MAKKAAADKRVFEIVARLEGTEQWRRLVVSADATLVELFLTVFGAFRWGDMFAGIERSYCVVVGDGVDETTYERGRGSRTVLRRMLDVGKAFRCESPGGEFIAACTVEDSYIVQSRRHHPKMLDGGPDCDTRSGTWNVQGAARREYEYREIPEPEQSVAFTYGLWTATIAGPLLMPSEWLPYAMPQEPADSIEDAQERVGGILAAYNVVAQMLQKDRDAYVERTIAICTGGRDDRALIDWGRGFAACMALRADEWKAALRDEAFGEMFMPIGMVIGMGGEMHREILRDASTRNELAKALGTSAFLVAEYWRNKLLASRGTVRRDSPKVGANEPCSCGSGKKYKRCCGSHLRVV